MTPLFYMGFNIVTKGHKKAPKCQTVDPEDPINFSIYPGKILYLTKKNHYGLNTDKFVKMWGKSYDSSVLYE